MLKTRNAIPFVRTGANVCLAATLAIWAWQPAQAADGKDPGARQKMRAPELTLQAAASSQVPQDTVTITLATEVEAADQSGINKPLNDALDAVMKAAKQAEQVKARNGSYRIWANTDRDGKVTGWRGRAEVLLESKDFAAASTLAGKLATTMPIAGIDFSLSDQVRQAEEERLLVDAAKSFRDRAQSAAQAFGFSGYRIGSIDLSGSGTVFSPQQPKAMMMSARAGSAMADVPLEADTVTVTVSVNGKVWLQSAGK